MISHPIRNTTRCTTPPAIDPDGAVAQQASQDDGGGTQQPTGTKTGKEPTMPTLPAPEPHG